MTIRPRNPPAPGCVLRSLGSPAEEVERTLRTGRDRGGAERATAETSRCHQSRPPGCWLRSAEAGASLHPLTHHTWARVLLLAVVAVLVLAELLLVCCWGAKSSWPKLLSATTILPTRYAHETLDHCSIDVQRLRRLRGRGRQQNPPDLRRREQHAPMLGRSRAAHRSAASATAARGKGFSSLTAKSIRISKPTGTPSIFHREPRSISNCRFRTIRAMRPEAGTE